AVAARRASRSGLRVVLVPARPLAQGELRRGIDGREVERERAALARRALEVDLAAEEAGDLAGDREAEAGAAVVPRHRAVGLLEGLEDHLLLVLGDPDAGVPHREPDDPVGFAEPLGVQGLVLGG